MTFITQTLAKFLKQQQTDMKKSMACKMEETQNMSIELVNLEVDMKCKTKQLHGLRLTNEEMDRTLKDLKTEYQYRQFELTEQRKLGQKRLVQADQITNGFVVKFSDACITVDDWKTKLEQLVIVYQKLKAARDVENCRTQATLSGLYGDSEKLSCQLTDILYQLTATITDNQRLLVALKKESEWLACLTAQVDRMEQRKDHECMIQSIERIKCDTEITLLKNEQTVEDHKLLLAGNEVDELRWLSNCSMPSLTM